MATRIHIVGARNCSRKEFENAFRGIGPLRADCANGWLSARFSVWVVEEVAIDDCLRRLPGPGLRITSEDACRWHLRLFKQGETPYLSCHPFGSLIREDQGRLPEPAHVPSKALRKRWADLISPSSHNPSRNKDAWRNPDSDEQRTRNGMDGIAAFLFDMRTWFRTPLPRERVEQWLALPYCDAMTAFFEWQAQDITDALIRFGIPMQREAVEATLTGENLSALQFETDLGNMPRFLLDLGLDCLD